MRIFATQFHPTNPQNNMTELQLKYGCNPNQKPSRIFMADGSELPIQVLSGRPGYINFLDAFNAWQLVRELKAATGLPAAASFKHVSPAGAAVGLPMSDTLRHIYWVDDVPFELSPIATAYARARGADRMSSYGDFIALSDTCDEATALLIKREVSDGVIAPAYTPEALAILQEKRKGTYNVIQMDPDYRPEPIERKQVYGITFEQGRNEVKLDDPALFANIPTQNKDFPAEARRDLIIALITLKYTQSNSVCYVKDGQAIGIGAGQQSRIHCTRLAGQKADIWWLRQHPQVMALPFVPGIRRADRDNTIDIYISEDHDDVLRDGEWQRFFTERPAVLTREQKAEWIAQLSGVSLGSDAFFPFGDNIERAHKSGVQYVAQAGGSVRDDHVIETCDRYGIAMTFTGVRLFHH
ncbi:MAG: phosphoribosylaminoimidazolecarboxamide formyltransferase [Bacteroidaceae bacterium]|nr:phosphoribosylaminoimidazolecarboxamide formyltransferase [Bacteroidaceae bacterium]